MRLSVIGDGGWGTTIAINLAKSGHEIKLWGPFSDYIETLKKTRENIKFLPGVKIPKEIELTSDICGAVEGAGFIVIAVPSQYMREVLEKLESCEYKNTKFISATKGIESKTLLRMSEVITQILGDVKISVISGPSIAYETARELPTTIVVASEDAGFSKEVQSIFSTDRFRVYTSSDKIGVEVGGSLKNVIAIASGIADGLGFGANSKAAILTRGMQEIRRLGVAMGADRETFSGLSCMGDLITTCMSKHSRNRWLGEEIGKGKKPQDVIGSTEMVVEGFVTAGSAYELAKKYNVDMPITNEVYNVLYGGKDPKEVVISLMSRTLKDEIY